MVHTKEIYKDDISSLIEDAIGKLDKVDAQANEQKKQIVVDLAKGLEDKIPTETICMEIVDKLHGLVSPRFIRECLDDKYKQEVRMINAKKQKRHQRQEPDSLAAVAPLISEVATDKITIFDKDDPTPDTSNDDDNKSSIPTAIDASDAGITLAESPRQERAEEQLNKNQVIAGHNDIVECVSCIELCAENLELMDALKKSSQMTTADKMTPKSADDNDNESLNFEFSKPSKDICQQFESLFEKNNDNEEVWFRVTIDKVTGKVISFNIGRKSQQQRQQQDESSDGSGI